MNFVGSAATLKGFVKFVKKNIEAPLVEKKVRGRNTPWLSSKIKNVMKERDYFYRKARMTNSELNWSRYKSSNQVTMMIRKAKANYNKKIIEENSDNPKNFWKAVKKMLPSKTTKSQSPSSPEPMTVNGNTTTDLFTIANGFCTYFTNVVEQLLSNMPSPTQSHQRVETVLKRTNGNLL